MRLAVLADLHANLPALEAVLDDVARERPDRIVVLGDLIGYGASPAEVVTRVQQLGAHVVAGNHDREITREERTPGTSRVARSVVDWTKEQLTVEQLDYLVDLPGRHVEGSTFIGVHGCYLNEHHVTGYVTDTMLPANLDAIESRDEWPDLAFCGHTHTPMVAWRLRGAATDDVAHVRQSRVTWPTRAVVLLNPGSVGQPRDGDTRASYALVDCDTRHFELRRVSYSVESAAQKILESGLDPSLAERLREGR